MQHLLTIFLDFWLHCSRFCQCYQHDLNLHFSPDHRKVVSGTPHKFRDTFSGIATIVSRVGTILELATVYVHSPGYFKIIKKALRHFHHLLDIYTLINDMCFNVRRNTWFSPRICILIGWTNLQYLYVTDCVLLHYYVVFVKKEPFPVLGMFKVADLKLNMCYNFDHPEFFPAGILCEGK